MLEALQADPETAPWIVLPSVNIAEYQGQLEGEVDLVIVVPGLGVLCLCPPYAPETLGGSLGGSAGRHLACPRKG